MACPSDSKERILADSKGTNGKASSTASVPTHIKLRRLGVWDFYEEVEPPLPWIATAPLLDKCNELLECWPYVLRMLRDVFTIPGCSTLVLVYAITELGLALTPAVTIWYVIVGATVIIAAHYTTRSRLNGQLLHVVSSI